MLETFQLTLDEWIFVGILLFMVYGIGLVPRWVDQLVLGKSASND